MDYVLIGAWTTTAGVVLLILGLSLLVMGIPIAWLP